MQKIPSLYVRNPENMRFVLPQLNETCRWVIAEDGTNGPVRATIKWDGTCVMRDIHGQWWARHQVRPDKKVPENYIPVEHDPVTGKTQGWIPMADSQYRKFFEEAVAESPESTWRATGVGTFELIGPRIGANPHRKKRHELIRHGEDFLIPHPPTEYTALAQYLRNSHEIWGYFEGIVWHNDVDGRMAKIKTRDFLENRD